MHTKFLFVAGGPDLGLVGPDGQRVTSAFHAGTDVAMHDLATRIVDDCLDEHAPDVLVLDLHLRFKDKDYTEASALGGIALLKFLRIMGVRQHVVLLSPLSQVELLRIGPAHYIVASPGVTVAPYEYDMRTVERVLGLSMADLAKQLGPEGDALRPYLKAGIALPQDARHDWANWWGMHRLIQEVKSYGKGPAMAVPDALQQKLRDLKSAEVAFVYGADDVVTPGEKMPFLYDSKILLVDDQANEGWRQVLEQLHRIGSDKASRSELVAVEPTSGSLVDRAACERFYSTELAVWLTGQNDKGFKADRVVLDLRLDPEQDASAAREGRSLSGMVLLEVLREAHPGLPILVFTASRDPEVHGELFSSGVDRIWIKPGLDRQGATIERPYALPSLVSALNVLGSQEYRLLSRYGQFLKRVMDGEEHFWWRSHTFNNGDGTFHDTTPHFANQAWAEAFYHILETGLLEFRSLLQYSAADRPGTSRVHAQRMAALISRLGLLVDYIHFGGKREGVSVKLIYNTAEPSQSRSDLMGWLLVVYGVQASRTWSSRFTHHITLRTFLEVLLDYLDCTEYPARSAAHYPLPDIFPLVWKVPWWYVPENRQGIDDEVLASYILGKNLVDHTKALLMKER